MIFKCAVIGLGNIGLKYDLNKKDQIKTHTKSFLAHPKTELIAGIDNNIENRELFEKNTSVSTFDDIEEIPEVDIIAISVPTSLHLSVLKNAVLKRPKLIILEKPIVQTLEEFREAEKFSKSCDIPIFINYIRRTDPSSDKLKQAYLSGSLGKFLEGEVSYNKGLFNTATHFMDFLQFLLGDITKVQKIGSAKKIDHDYEVDFDLFFDSAKCRFKSYTNHQTHNNSQKYIFEKGLIEINQGPIVQLNGTAIKHDYSNYQLNALNHVIDHLENDIKLISDFSSGMKSVKVCLDLLK